MLKRLFILLFFCVIAFGAWYAGQEIEWGGFIQIMRSAIAIAILYIIFRIFLDLIIIRRLKDSQAVYRFRKTLGVIFYLACTVVLVRIWIENPEALLVSYGIVAAGAAIALQDLFKNVAGGVVVVLNNLFRVGDRIEIDNLLGDVIDVGLFNTTMFEIGNWVDGDQATGRLGTIPNGIFLSNHVINYTRDHDYIWDEVMLPVSYQSDWKKASRLFRDIANRRTKDFQGPAERQLKKLSRKFFLSERNSSATTYIKPTDNWIQIHVRYIAKAKERRIISNDILTSMLGSAQRHDEIEIASETLDIIGFPK